MKTCAVAADCMRAGAAAGPAKSGRGLIAALISPRDALPLVVADDDDDIMLSSRRLVPAALSRAFRTSYCSA